MVENELPTVYELHVYELLKTIIGCVRSDHNMSMMKKTASSNLVMLVLDLDQSPGRKYLFPSEKQKTQSFIMQTYT